MDWYKKKKITIPLVFIIFFLAVRIGLEPVFKNELNKFLANFSETLYFEVADLDFHIVRGAYSFEGVQGKIKGRREDFISIKDVDISIAWKQILRGRILTEIYIDGLNISYTKALKDAISRMPKKKDEAQTAKDKLFPVKIERVILLNGKIVFDDYPGLEKNKKLSITNVEGQIANLTPKKDEPLSSFDLKGSLMNEASVTFSGQLNTQVKPLQWNLDGVMHEFDLTTANQFLRRKVPMTFTKGSLDLYAEAKSEEGKVRGYIKPFMKDLDIVKTDENFKGPKHWAVEVISAIGNVILRAPDVKSVATRIPFSSDKGEITVEKGEALSKAIEHGFEEKLKPGIEDKYELQ